MKAMSYSKSKVLNINQYWYSWFCAVGIFLLLRFLILSNASDETKYTLFSTYAFLTWFPIMGIGFYHGWKFRHYLDKQHPIIFKKYFSHAYGMITIDDPIGLLKFAFSKKKDVADDLLKIRRFQKQILFFVMTVFITYPLLFVTTMIWTNSTTTISTRAQGAWHFWST